MESVDRLLAELKLVVGLAEPGPPPGDGEQRHQPLQTARVGLSRGLLAVEALQHLVDHDPEALVDGGLLWDSEDPRELVLQRAGAVELDVGGGESQSLAAPREEGLQRGLIALCDQLAPPLCRSLLVEQVGVEAGVAQSLALLG